MGRLFGLGILGTLSGKEIGARVLACAGAGVLGCWGAVVLGAQVLSAQTGSISGTITTTAKGLAPVRVTIDQKVCGNELPDQAVVVDGQGHLANAVVVLTGVKRLATEATITNDKCAFAPRVQIVRSKANVKTTSKDPILHTTNAQLENGRTLFNVALPIAGLTVTKSIGNAGTVRLSCNTHPWMRGWVVVTDDLAGVTGADGRFSLDNVPRGTYELRIWHESLKSAPQKITVTAGKPTEVTVQMK